MRGDNKNPFAGRRDRTTTSSGVPLDVLVTPDQYLIDVDLPGVALEDIELTLEDGELTIQAGRTRPEATATRKDYAFFERKFGAMSRTISLPGAYGTVAGKTLANGVLSIAIGRKGTHEQLS